VIDAAAKTKDLDSVCIALAKSKLKRNGSITTTFEYICKEVVSYSHYQHTYIKTRYIVLPKP